MQQHWTQWGLLSSKWAYKWHLKTMNSEDRRTTPLRWIWSCWSCVSSAKLMNALWNGKDTCRGESMNWRGLLNSFSSLLIFPAKGLSHFMPIYSSSCASMIWRKRRWGLVCTRKINWLERITYTPTSCLLIILLQQCQFPYIDVAFFDKSITENGLADKWVTPLGIHILQCFQPHLSSLFGICRFLCYQTDLNLHPN